MRIIRFLISIMLIMSLSKISYAAGVAAKPHLPHIALGTGALTGAMPDKSFAMNIEEQAELIAGGIELFRKYKLDPWIDTAPLYGNGNALIATGLALGREPAKDINLSIKIGRILEEPTAAKPYIPGDFVGEGRYNIRFDYSAKGVEDSFKQNFDFLNKKRREKGWRDLTPQDFKNLVVYVHDPDQAIHGENILTQIRKEALPELYKLKLKGELNYIGLGTNEVATALRLIDSEYLDFAMVAGRLTLLANNAPKAPVEIKQDTMLIEELIKQANKHAKFIISAAPGNSGLMYPQGNWYNYKPASQEVIAFRNEIISVFNKYNTPVEYGIFKYPLHAGAIATVMAAYTLAQIEENIKNSFGEVPKEVWEELKTRELINPNIELK